MPSYTGQSLGRYHILEQLGEGGMATVYKAYDTRLERDVAVKIIRVDQFAPAVLDRILKRFEREAKALARLTHPNIVHVNDYGEENGIPYLVMDYLPGGTLKQLLGKPMAWQEAARLVLPVAQALAYAHEHGILHRDVKPSNILLAEKGQPLLTDFGIAKILDLEDGQTLTGAGVGVGTPEYMAPEQWTGKAGEKSDIYSLGVVLYELVTGSKPYSADAPAAVLLKQSNEPLPRPGYFVPGLPEGVEKLLLKALAKEPDNRYEHMAGFAAALENLVSGVSLQPQTFERIERATDEKAPGLPRMDDSMGTFDQGALTGDQLSASIRNGTSREPVAAQHGSTPVKPAREKKKPSRKRMGLIWSAIMLCIIAVGGLTTVYFLYFYPVLLNAQFYNPKSGWPSWENEFGKVGYMPASGLYEMAYFQPGGWDSAWSPKEYSDFSLETDFCTLLSQPEMGAGVHFRTGPGRGYLFWIYPQSREYTFILWRNDAFETLIPRTQNNLVVWGYSDTHDCMSVKINVYGGSGDIYVKVRDEYQLLTQIDTSAFSSGYLGPSVDAPKEVFTPSPVYTWFEYIKVLRYKP